MNLFARFTFLLCLFGSGIAQAQFQSDRVLTETCNVIVSLRPGEGAAVAAQCYQLAERGRITIGASAVCKEIARYSSFHALQCVQNTLNKKIEMNAAQACVTASFYSVVKGLECLDIIRGKVYRDDVAAACQVQTNQNVEMGLACLRTNGRRTYNPYNRCLSSQESLEAVQMLKELVDPRNDHGKSQQDRFNELIEATQILNFIEKDLMFCGRR